MNDYVETSSGHFIRCQSSPDDCLSSSEENLQQYIAHLISENQYLQQKLKASQKKEKTLIEENLRLKAEYEQLNGQQTFLGTLLQQIADGVMIVSRQGTIYYINEAASVLLGRTLEELQDYDWGYPIGDGKTEICIHRRDRSTIIAQLRVSEITWDQHHAYLVSLRNITEEKRSQAKLQESETRFRLVANTAPVLIWMANREGKLTFVNHNWSRITGQVTSEIIGSKWLEAIHPDDFTDYWQTYYEAIAEKTSFQIQFRLKHPQKGYQWLSNRGVPRLTSEGELLGFIGSCIDISDHKHLEEELLKVTQAVACSGEAIAILEQQGTLIYQNPAFEKLFSHSREEINELGGINQLFLEKDNMRLSQGLEEIQTNKIDWRGELTLKRPQGEKQQINLQIDRIVNPNDCLIGLVLIATDISQQKRAEAQLKRANRQLKASIKQLATTNREIAQLSTMVKLLQGCSRLEEAYEVLKRQIPKLFCRLSGGLFLKQDSDSLLESLIHWGEDFNSETIFSTKDCWSLRHFNLHWSLDPNYIPCFHQHQTEDNTLETLCIPLNARSESLGMLYLSIKKRKKPQLEPNYQQFCQMVAENIAVALSNLKLREQLRQEAICDPLTHLYNRRYLEVSLEREIARSKRKKQVLTVLMIDVDYFKRINDNFCHAAGDIVLKKLSAYLQQNIRGSDIACRFGGEELTLIFPETTLEQGKNRAEQLRKGIKELSFRFQNQDLGNITASFGLASYPQQGETGQDILHIADLALYCAKESGRDRVISANMMLDQLSVISKPELVMVHDDGKV
ncbi:MAG: diguanylate cyclase [Microcystaceae cyanobacterium]